jgi:acetyl-CoA C-acetyltransferase
MNSIIGYYTTQFGELWDNSLFDLVQESIEGVLKNSDVEKQQIDAVFFGNMLGGIAGNTLLSEAHIAEMMGMHIPVFRAEAACASGGMAFYLANQYLNANPNKTVVVVGAEKMTDISAEDVTRALGSAASEEEQAAGLSFPGLYGMMAQVYLQQYGYDEEHLAYISVKNHYHGSFNEKAHFRKAMTVEQILKSPYVAYPLKVLNSSAISDGAAAVVITNEKIKNKNEKLVNILATEVATDCINLKSRKSLTELEATKVAGAKAFAFAKLSPHDIDVAEVHDCFSIAEILAMEDLGFWKKGTGGTHAKNLATQLGISEKLVINTSGGLKAAGHPVGATGIKQIGELFLQLTGQAGKRQVKNTKYGLAHNVGGSGGVAVVTIVGS